MSQLLLYCLFDVFKFNNFSFYLLIAFYQVSPDMQSIFNWLIAIPYLVVFRMLLVMQCTAESKDIEFFGFIFEEVYGPPTSFADFRFLFV